VFLMNSQRQPSGSIRSNQYPIIKSLSQVKGYLAIHPNENRKTVGIFYKNKEVQEYSRKDSNTLGAKTLSQYQTKKMSLDQKYEAFQPSVHY
jgi:hypothetical protein